MSFKDIISELNLPKDFYVVSTDQKERNHDTVTVIRYQAKDKVTPNNRHITIVFDNNDQLISFNNSSFLNEGKLPTEQEAVEIAMETWNKFLPEYAKGLSFMRIDHQTREYTNDEGVQINSPILWIKFAHRNGSYNWVTIGVNNQIIEIERESEWDYMRGRRSTEMWNYDNWVLAREGKGPQLKAPDALA